MKGGIAIMANTQFTIPRNSFDNFASFLAKFSSAIQRTEAGSLTWGKQSAVWTESEVQFSVGEEQ